MEIVVSCEYGIEYITIDELSELGYDAQQLVPTRILISDADVSDIYHLSIAARTIHRVFVLIGDFECRSMDDIIQAGRSVDFSDWMHVDQTFGIRGIREGTQDFGSMDIAREIGSVVVDHFTDRTGKRISVNLDDPDVEIVAHHSGQRFLLLIPTSTMSLHKRIDRPYQHFAGLKSSIAAAMLRMSEWKNRQSLLDPMAGSGIIPIEAALQAGNIVPGLLADPSIYKFSRLAFLSPKEFQNVLEVYRGNTLPENKYRIISADKYAKSVTGMRQNFSGFGLENDIRAVQGKADHLSYIEPGEMPCIVTNPPYGMRIGNPQVVKALYSNFARACAEKQVEEVVAITPRRHHWIVSFTSNGYKLDHLQRFYFGRLNVYLMRLKADKNQYSSI